MRKTTKASKALASGTALAGSSAAGASGQTEADLKAAKSAGAV